MNPPGIVPIIALAIVNGLFSPLLALIFALQGLWYPFFLPNALPVVFALSSLILSTLYLMVSGVPAALYERLAGGGQASFASRMIWLVVMAILTLPSLPFVLKALGME
jgi:hypothetical protein